MANVDELERELRAAEAATRAAITLAEPAVVEVEKIIQTFSDIAGRDRPRGLMLAIDAAEQGRAELVAGIGRAQSALADIREAIADLHQDSSTAGQSATTPAATPTTSAIELSSSDPTHVRRLNKPPANATIVVDGRFRYQTDDHGRVVKATATLETVDLEHPRSDHAQKTLSGKLPGDDAGHLFARIFKGPGQKVNLVPMESLGVNRGKYRQLERRWRAAIEAGHEVVVEVRLKYSGDERRPKSMIVEHTYGDEHDRVWIKNPRKGGR